MTEKYMNEKLYCDTPKICKNCGKTVEFCRCNFCPQCNYKKVECICGQDKGPRKSYCFQNQEGLFYAGYARDGKPNFGPNGILVKEIYEKDKIKFVHDMQIRHPHLVGCDLLEFEMPKMRKMKVSVTLEEVKQ